MIFQLAALAAAVASVKADRTFTVTNNCAQTVWPGLYTSGGTAPSQATGWEQDSGTSTQFTVPEGWNGRIWGRTECDFSSVQDQTSCVTGGCIGGEACTQPGVPPATLFEFNLASDQDWYDVSNVDGSNLPGSITGAGDGCTNPACSFDLNSACPSELAVTDSSGAVVGCESACVALGGDNNCCSGADDTPDTCPSSGVQDYDYFHSNCPQAYAYAYDDNNALFTCATSDASNYIVTFCPSS